METVGDFCRLHVRVRATTDVGQQIAISGNAYALGNSNKERVVKLVTSPESYPIWYTASPIVIPRGEGLNYRYCLLEGGTVKAFERAQNTRALVIEQLDTVVEDEIGLNKLEGFGQDSEMELFKQMKMLTKPQSEADKMFWLNAAQRDARLLLVCYHLPVTVVRTGDASRPFEATWNDSIIAKGKDSISDSMRTTWVGTLQGDLNGISEEEKAILSAVLLAMDCVPVFIDEKIINAAYLGFCKEIMWPVFHNVDQLDQIHAAWNLQDSFRNKFATPSLGGGLGTRSRNNSMSERLSLGAPDTGAGAGGGPGAENRTLEWNNLEEEYHLAYAAVNKIFARTLLGLLDNRDVVWVHDYHLMSLPKLLREAVGKNAQAKCGFKHDDTDKDSRNVSSTTTDAFEKINTELRRPLTAPADLHDIKIIFFMHIPFPTSQIFRTLTRATELLESMCSADVVGFHAFDHARHFLNATKRMLGIRSGSRPGGLLTLNVQDREVIVTVSHVSIETVRIAQAAAHPETQRIARELREKHAGKRIIAGIDVCQRLSGVALKLAAFDKMLSDSSWGKRGNIVLLQRVVRTGSRPGDEATTASDLRKMVDDINGKYVTSAAASAARMMGQRSSEECLQTSLVSPSASASASTSSSSDTPAVQPTSLDVLDYAELTSAPNIHERMAFWLVADVILLTPIREGLNLYPLEYIYARREMPNPGVVVVSEFSTCSALLNGSLKINPFAPLHVADALEKALMLSTKDKDLRRQRDLPFISSHPSSLWTQHILNDLEALQPSGGGAGGRGQSDQQYPVPLDTKKMLSCYESAAHNAGICDRASRVFVLDYGGTLLPKEKYDIYIKRQTLSAIAGRKPSAGMMAALKELSDDPRNVVMVVTGLTKLKLGDTFQGLHNLTLATSNGLVYSWGLNLLPPTHVLRSREVQAPTLTLPSKRVRKESPPQSAQQQQQGQDTKDATGPNGDGKGDLLLQSLADEERDWGFLACNIDWRGVSDIAIPIITKFTYRTNGTCQTPRIPGIGWSYFGADPEEGYKQSKQLKLELEAALARFDVQITSLIQGSIEVVPRTLHKGLLVRPLLEKVCQMRGGRLPGLLCVVGDEESDDKMINVVYDVLSNAPANADVRRCKAFTVTVARRVCPAQFYVNDVEDVEELLASLAASDTTIPAPTTTTPSAPFASAPGPTDAMPDMRHEVTASFL